LSGLKEKAKLVTELFNKIKGVSCNPVQGAMYAFPQIQIPQKAIDHAKV
jgi:alanine transaminase